MIESSLRAPPPFCDFGQHNSEAAAGSAEIVAFSFRVLRTILRKSGFIKWSFWRRTAKRFIPVESTCLTVKAPLSRRALRLQKLTVMSKKHFLLLSIRDPPIFVLARPSASQGARALRALDAMYCVATASGGCSAL